MYIIIMGVFYSDEKYQEEQSSKKQRKERLKEREQSMEVKDSKLIYYAKGFLERYFNTYFIYKEDKQKLIQLCKDKGFYEKDVLDEEPKKFLRELFRTSPEYHKYLWNSYAFVLYEDTSIPKREKEYYDHRAKLRHRLREPLACDALYNILEKSELALHKQDLIYYYAVLNFCKGGWRTELRYNLDVMDLLEKRLNKFTLTNKDLKYLINKSKDAKVFIVRTSEHESNILGFIKFLHKLPKEKGFSYDYITLSTLHHFELNDNTEEIIDLVINKEPEESIKTNTLMYLWIKINEEPLVKGDKYDSFLNGFFVPNNFDVDLIKVLNKVQDRFHKFQLNLTEQELLTFIYSNEMNRVQQYKFLEYIEKVFGTKMNQDIKSVLFKNINQLDLRSYKHEKREIKTEDIKIDFD